MRVPSQKKKLEENGIEMEPLGTICTKKLKVYTKEKKAPEAAPYRLVCIGAGH